MIIDAHQHAFWLGHDDGAIVKNMDEHGIDLTWLLTWEGWADEVDEVGYAGSLDPRGDHVWLPLQGVVEACRRYPDRFVAGYCPNPRDPLAPGKLEAAVRLFGIKACGEWKFRLPLDDPRCIALFWKAAELGLPVTFHLDMPFLPPATGRDLKPYWYGGTVSNLERALQQCPETILIGHAPGFWREISGDADESRDSYPTGPVTPDGKLWRLFDTYPNLYADLSAGSAHRALSRDLEVGRRFIMCYSERVLFGRDYFDGEMMALLRRMELPEEVFDRVAGGNAAALTT